MLPMITTSIATIANVARRQATDSAASAECRRRSGAKGENVALIRRLSCGSDGSCARGSQFLLEALRRGVPREVHEERDQEKKRPDQEQDRVVRAAEHHLGQLGGDR